MNRRKYNSTKGVSIRKNGKFEAYVSVKQAGKRSNAKLKVYVGVYPTEDEAHDARVKFIKTLL